MTRTTNDAVSPVIGVMLMIVVTIIIAAVVSAFAGGISADEGKPPSLTLSCSPVIAGIADTDTSNMEPNPGSLIANNGLVCTHTGGEGFSLHDIAVQLQSSDKSITIDLTKVLNTTGSCVKSDDDNLMHTSTGDPTYFYRIGGGSGDFIKPGDKFMLVADSCRIEPDGSRAILWFPIDSQGRFEAYLYSSTDYSIIHKPSGKAITTGSFFLQ
ncbi:MAG: type IV pilin N-terminal domain-containing protein [Methanoregula sp.]|jgi:FlaG/FlaF family flagellin (archaellin)